MPLDSINDVADPTWGSGDEDLIGTVDSRALDGSCQGMEVSDTYPRRLTLLFNNLSNVKFDALCAFLKAHLLPPTPFLATDRITDEIIEVMIEGKTAKLSYDYSGFNRSSTQVNVITQQEEE